MNRTSRESKHIAVVGAGLVGALAAIYLKRRGYRVSVFERRADLRKIEGDAGRSINLALSNRGLRALQEVDMAEELRKLSVPMNGRIIHNRNREVAFQPYGEEGQFINSMSRLPMTRLLIEKAEAMGVQFYFEHRCRWVDLGNSLITFEHPHGSFTKSFDTIIGADGVFSSVRSMMQLTDRFDYAQTYLKHGYKELNIPADDQGQFSLEPHALHIWPRESFMLIALPNRDHTFTGTLFLSYEGNPSFASVNDKQSTEEFFKEVFPDVANLMPDLANDYRRNPTSSLMTISCYPWVINNTLVIGDAAHGILPFFGQGLNSGFEDCRILNNLLDHYEDNWAHALEEYQRVRKPDADAIAQLAYDNFVEMRDLVADPAFLLRKKIEAKLHDLFPAKWTPLYSMVTFHDEIRYSEAYAQGQKQRAIMDEVMALPGIDENWNELNLAEIANRL